MTEPDEEHEPLTLDEVERLRQALSDDGVPAAVFVKMTRDPVGARLYMDHLDEAAVEGEVFRSKPKDPPRPPQPTSRFADDGPAVQYDYDPWAEE